MLRTTINSGILKECIDAVMAVTKEGKFNVSESGMSLKGVDSSNIAMITLELGKNAFLMYDAVQCEIGIDLKRFSDLMAGEKEEDVRLETTPDLSRLIIQLGGLTYTISLLDPSTIKSAPKIPDIELPCEIVLTGSEFRHAIRAAEKISDYILLGVDYDRFFMEAEGDMDRVRFEMTKDELISLTPGTVKSLYPVEYLSKMSKVIEKVPMVKIELGTNVPVRLSFDIADGSGKAGYLLAPRVEEE
ncbi:MAG: DNA polymerase sliding clamp [Candidatus Syntropharchaeia archaeon]